MWLIIALFGFLCLGQALSGAYIKKWHQFSAPLKLHQLNSLSRFPRSVESNSQWFDFGLLHNMIGLENSSPCCPVWSNTKTNRGSFTRVFPRLASAACLHVEFWLVHSLVSRCSLSLDRVFFLLVSVLRHSNEKNAIVYSSCNMSAKVSFICTQGLLDLDCLSFHRRWRNYNKTTSMNCNNWKRN